jgi:hypothetical protein
MFGFGYAPIAIAAKNIAFFGGCTRNRTAPDVRANRRRPARGRRGGPDNIRRNATPHFGFPRDAECLDVFRAGAGIA